MCLKNRMIVLSVIIWFLSIPVMLHAGTQLPREIQSIIDAPRYVPSQWGILVADLKTGKAIYELNADKLFAPASTTKLFTMATGLDTFGADYQFETLIYRNAPVNSAGELKGDLILVASGDLTLGGRTDVNGHIAFTGMDHTDAGMDGALSAVLTKQNPLAGINNLASQVAASGIKRVCGDVIIDDRLFETSTAGHGFVRTPITVNDNLIDFVITPSEPGMDATVKWRPRTSAYRVDAQLKTVASMETPRVLITSGGSNRILVSGQVPAKQKPYIRVRQVEDPASFARTLLIEALQRTNVKVDISPYGKNPSVRLPERNAYKKMESVALLKSPPYSETVKLILKVSHNLGADITPLLVAAKNGKQTFEEGMALEGVFLKRAGVDLKSISLADGEGGEQGDVVTPRAAVQILRYMTTRTCFKAYHDALPVLGVDGSLAHAVPPDSPARGKVHAKTGTIVQGDLLNDRPILLVKALAGYITASGGRKLAFAFYVNNVPIKELNDMLAVGNDLGKISEAVYLAE